LIQYPGTITADTAGRRPSPETGADRDAEETAMTRHQVVLAVIVATSMPSLVAETEQPCTPGNVAVSAEETRTALDALK
jgi:hypothetical protein